MPLNYIEVLLDSCLHTAWHGVCEPIVHTSTSRARSFPPSPRRLEHKANWLTNMDKLVLCFVPLVAALGRAAQHERLTACSCAKLVRAAAVISGVRAVRRLRLEARVCPRGGRGGRSRTRILLTRSEDRIR